MASRQGMHLPNVYPTHGCRVPTMFEVSGGGARSGSTDIAQERLVLFMQASDW